MTLEMGFFARFIALLLATAVSALFQPLSTAQVPLPLDHSQGYEFDPLLHLPGTSPYFDAVGFGLRHGAPLGCKVTSASYLVRHAAIYANDDEYEEYIKPFLWKLEKNRGSFRGDMEFLNTWHSPILEDHLEDVTPSGKADAKKVGKHLLQLYPDLIPRTKRILADKKARTFDTATAMIEAFPDPDSIEIVQILRDVNGSMDALIPHKSCPAFSKEPGRRQMEIFVNVYGTKTAKRLARDAAFAMTPRDVLGLQSICGYQSAIQGKRSQICALFTDEEWMAYEYAWDLRYAHMVGPLNPLSPFLGFPWLQSQLELLDDYHQGSTAHDGWPNDQHFFPLFYASGSPAIRCNGNGYLQFVFAGCGGISNRPYQLGSRMEDERSYPVPWACRHGENIL